MTVASPADSGMYATGMCSLARPEFECLAAESLTVFYGSALVFPAAPSAQVVVSSDLLQSLAVFLTTVSTVWLCHLMVECTLLPSYSTLMWSFTCDHVGVTAGTPDLAMLLLRATVAPTYLPLFNLKKCLPMLTPRLRWQHFFI